MTISGEAYIPNATGTIYRARGVVAESRWLTAVEGSITGGKGNPWLTGVLAAGYLSYEAYQWYQTTPSTTSSSTGQSVYYLTNSGSMLPLGYFTDPQSACNGYRSDQSSKHSTYIYGSATVTNAQCDVSLQMTTGGSTYHTYATIASTPGYSCTSGSTLVLTDGTHIDSNASKSAGSCVTNPVKNPISEAAALAALLAQLNGVSSRYAFGSANQPYPMDGLFDTSNLSVDPTYQPSADINSGNLQDWITKYNMGQLQTTDPSAPNYVTPAQYKYLQDQANQQAATNANPSAASSTTLNFLTQSQYEASNQKTDDAGKSAINAVDTSSMDNYRTTSGFDGNQGNLDNKINDISGMASPVVNPTLDLPQGGSCRQIPISFSVFGHQYNTLLPTDEWCLQLQKLKQAMAYFFYILTAVGIVYELIRRPVEGN